MAARIVITGAGGQVGRNLAVEADRRGYAVHAVTRGELDITDPGAVDALVRNNDVVVNCAAFTNVDDSEAHPDAALAINAVGPGNIARSCAKVDARLIHISSDYVFSGNGHRPYEISDATDPLSVYGKSKLAGELAVLAALPGAHVVRTSWVYTGASGNDFVAVMRRLAASDGAIDVVADQTGSPTYVRDLVSSLLEIVEGGVRGPLLHVANVGAVSRFEQARAVFEMLGAAPERVRPVTTAEFPRPARRPAYSALSMTESVRAGLSPPRPWRDALGEALAAPLDIGRIPSTP